MNKVILLLLLLFICFLFLNAYSAFSSSSGLNITFSYLPSTLPSDAVNKDTIITFDLVTDDGTPSSQDGGTNTKTLDTTKDTSISVNISKGQGLFISTIDSVYYYDYQTLFNIVVLQGNKISINAVSCNNLTMGNEPNYSTYIKSIINADSTSFIGSFTAGYANTISIYGIEQILRKWYYKSFDNTILENNVINFTVKPSTVSVPCFKVIRSINNQMNGYLNYSQNSSIEYQMYKKNGTGETGTQFTIPETGGLLIYIDSNKIYYPYSYLKNTSFTNIDFNVPGNIINLK